MAPNPHNAACYILESATRPNAAPWNCFDNKVVSQKHRNVRPAVMLVRESARLLRTRNCATNVSGRHITIEDQIAGVTRAKIRDVPERTDIIRKNVDADLADLENRTRINDLLRQSTRPAAQKSFQNQSSSKVLTAARSLSLASAIPLTCMPGFTRRNGTVDPMVVEKTPWVLAPTLLSNSTIPKPSGSTRTTIPENGFCSCSMTAIYFFTGKNTSEGPSERQKIILAASRRRLTPTDRPGFDVTS
jgi:hypothetical protein